MRQFTTSAAGKNNGIVLIIALVGLLLIGAFGAFLFMQKGGGQGPIRGSLERPASGSLNR